YNHEVILNCLLFNYSREADMRLNAPTQIVFLISVVIAVVALLAVFAVLPTLPIAPFWIMQLAFAELVVFTIIHDLLRSCLCLLCRLLRSHCTSHHCS